MKLYLKAKNKFLMLSIIILILSLLSIFILNNESIGYFLLGLFASSVVMVLQYKMSAEVEESTLLIDTLRKIDDICFEFNEFNTFSLEYFTVDFIKNYNKFKNLLLKLFKLNDELGSNYDLKKSTKTELDVITKKIINLEADLHFIFKEYEKASNKMKIIYFIEFYHIIKSFDFDSFSSLVSHLGAKIDVDAFYHREFIEIKNRKIKNLEYDTSIEVYNKKLESEHNLEYKALKSKFEDWLH